MEIIISSKQAGRILKEEFKSEFISTIEKYYNDAKEILEKTGNQIGENLKFLITWGASIGGMMGPLNQYINDKFPELTDMEVSLILTGVIANYYFDNKKIISKLVKKIKEDGLKEVFTEILSKGEELKRTFITFIDSLNITIHKMSNILSYAFIIPLIPLIYNGIAKGYITNNDVSEIVERILSFGVVTLSGLAVTQLVKKLIKRFSSKKV